MSDMIYNRRSIRKSNAKTEKKYGRDCGISDENNKMLDIIEYMNDN